MNRADIRVIERSSSTSFAEEPFETKLGGNRFRREEFQGDVTVQRGIARGIDDTHPATAEFLDDLVMRYGLADHRDAALTRRPESIWATWAGVKENSAESGEVRTNPNSVRLPE